MKTLERLSAVLFGEENEKSFSSDIALELQKQARNSRECQQLKCVRRFLKRWTQFENGYLSQDEFLMALRDIILFVGKISLPPRVLSHVWDHGESYGLHVEEPHFVVADIQREGWFPNASFVKQAYGRESCKTVERQRSVGDAILHRATSFSHYRSFEQKTAVHTALQMPDGYTLLLTLPTGAGKSLVGQMLACNNNGLTLVVVPTTALGKDQLRSARQVLRNSVNPVCIEAYCGEHSGSYLQIILQKLERHELRLMITSPEAIIKNRALRSALENASRDKYLEHLIIDEAHIVQDWGATFRPDFQFLCSIRNQWLTASQATLKTVLLSATLTEDVIEYLRLMFSEEDRWIELRCDSLRTEPRFLVDIQRNRQNHFARVIHYAKTLPKPMLIYCIRPQDAEEWQTVLKQAGLRGVETFTGLTREQERESLIRQWNEDELDIMIATSAFGMGVDKADVRTVMHVTLPESVNRFYQEVGRAGRDGLPCLSMLCYCPQSESGLQDKIVNTKILTVDNMLDRWFSMLKSDTAQRDADMVLLDTTVAPSHFTAIERQQRGARNRDWNIHVILFLVRHGLVRFADLKYEIASKKYLIMVKMCDVDLMTDKEALSAHLSPLRQQELETSQQSYFTLQEMVHNRERQCYAESFSQIYPYADWACGGCCNHFDGFSYADQYLLHNQVPPYRSVDQTALRHPIWYGAKDLLIAKSTAANQFSQVALLLNQAGIRVWIAADESYLKKAIAFEGLVITLSEAEYLLEHQPTLLLAASLLSFPDNKGEQQRLLKLAGRLKQRGCPVAYHASPFIVNAKTGRALEQEINGSILTEEEIKEAFDV